MMNIFEKLEGVARGVESTLKDEFGMQQIKSAISKEKGKINRLKEKIGDCCWKWYNGEDVQENKKQAKFCGQCGAKL